MYNLHSTMYLLKLIIIRDSAYAIRNLHSTMYLLKHVVLNDIIFIPFCRLLLFIYIIILKILSNNYKYLIKPTLSTLWLFYIIIIRQTRLCNTYITLYYKICYIILSTPQLFINPLLLSTFK